MQSDTLQQLKHDLKSQLKQANTTDSYNAFVKKSLDFFSVQKDINTMMRTALRTHKDVLMASYVSTSDSKRITDATRDIPYACHVHSITNRSVINEGIAASLKDPENKDRVQWAKDEMRKYCPWVKNYYCQSTPSVFDVPIEECLDMINVSDMSKDLLTSSVLHRIYFALHSAHNEAASPDVKNEYALLTGIERPQRAQLLLALCDMQAGGGFADMHKETLSPTKFREAWALTHCKKVQSQVEERGLQRLHDLISDLDEDNNPRYPILHKALVHGRVDLGNCFPKETESSFMWIRHIIPVVIFCADLIASVQHAMNARNPFLIGECATRALSCVFNTRSNMPQWEFIGNAGIMSSRLIADAVNFLINDGTLDPNQHHLFVYGFIMYLFFLLDACIFNRGRKRDVPLKAMWNLGIMTLCHVPAHIAGTYFMWEGYRLRDAFDFPDVGDRCSTGGFANVNSYGIPKMVFNHQTGNVKVDAVCTMVTQATLWAMAAVKMAQKRSETTGGAVYDVANMITPSWVADRIYYHNGDVVAQEKKIVKAMIISSNNLVDKERDRTIEFIDSEKVTAILVKSIVQNRPPDPSQIPVIPPQVQSEVLDASLRGLDKMQSLILDDPKEFNTLDIEVKKLLFKDGKAEASSYIVNKELIRKLLHFAPAMNLIAPYSMANADDNLFAREILEYSADMENVKSRIDAGSFKQKIGQKFETSVNSLLLSADGDLSNEKTVYTPKLKYFNHLVFIGAYLDVFQDKTSKLNSEIVKRVKSIAHQVKENTEGLEMRSEYKESTTRIASAAMMSALKPDTVVGKALMRAAETVSSALFKKQDWNEIDGWYEMLKIRAESSPVFGLARMAYASTDFDPEAIETLRYMHTLSPFHFKHTMRRQHDRADNVEGATRYQQSLFCGGKNEKEFMNRNERIGSDNLYYDYYHRRVVYAAQQGSKSPLAFFDHASKNFRKGITHTGDEKTSISTALKYAKNAAAVNNEIPAYTIIYYVIQIIKAQNDDAVHRIKDEIQIFFTSCRDNKIVDIALMLQSLYFAIEFFGVHAKDTDSTLLPASAQVVSTVTDVIRIIQNSYGEEQLPIDSKIFNKKEDVKVAEQTAFTSSGGNAFRDTATVGYRTLVGVAAYLWPF